MALSGLVLPGLILLAVSVGALLLGAAMSRYPGGTALDGRAAGHSFWLNFLCDLTADRALNGQANGAAAALARMALLCFSVALTCFWLIVPASFGSRCGRGVKLVITTSGLISVAGLLAVPFVGGAAHVAAVFASSIPALVAGVLALLATIRHSPRLSLVVVAAATVTASAVDAILYAHSYLIEPRVVGPALPTLQRLAMLLMLTWMTLVAARALWSAGSARPPRP